MKTSTSFALLGLIAGTAVAKTDLAGCTRTQMGNTYVYYVPDTGEICSLLDCGGGRAPPKTTVPGCAAYEGTATVTPSFLPGFGAAASTSTPSSGASTGPASTTSGAGQASTTPTATGGSSASTPSGEDKTQVTSTGTSSNPPGKTVIITGTKETTTGTSGGSSGANGSKTQGSSGSSSSSTAGAAAFTVAAKGAAGLVAGAVAYLAL